MHSSLVKNTAASRLTAPAQRTHGLPSQIHLLPFKPSEVTLCSHEGAFTRVWASCLGSQLWRQWTPSPSGHQLPVALQLGVGGVSPFSHQCWKFVWLDLAHVLCMVSQPQQLSCCIQKLPVCNSPLLSHLTDRKTHPGREETELTTNCWCQTIWITNCSLCTIFKLPQTAYQ